MNDELLRQEANVLPPRWGKVVALTANTTSVAYDLSSLDFGSAGALVAQGLPAGELWVELHSNATVYYILSDNASCAVDETARVAAGGAVAFTANACDYVIADERKPLRINRKKDRYIAIKAASGTPTFRLIPASPVMGGVKEL